MNTTTDDNKSPQAVILMGIPASGKSTFCARYFGAEKGYVRINRDTERSRGGVYSLLWKCLSSRRSFVMDNTQVRCFNFLNPQSPIHLPDKLFPCIRQACPQQDGSGQRLWLHLRRKPCNPS